MNAFLKTTLLLPFVAIVLLIAKAEHGRANGEIFRVPVAGFDPRDLVHGHYLTLQIDLDRLGGADFQSIAGDNVVCFQRTSEGLSVATGAKSEMENPSCTARTRAAQLQGPKRYLIPEISAEALENLLRDERVNAEVELILQESGAVSLGMLHLDGLPWREALQKKGESKDSPSP